MKEKMKPRSCDTISAASCKLAMHKDSHIISKLKPKIRIIHILAPQIIKTDVANFRELVQRLTGQPAERKIGTKNTSCSVPTKELRTHCPEHSKIMDSQEGIHILHNNGDRIKKEGEEALWGGENSNGFLGGFADMDSEFPLLPFMSSHMNLFGEMPLC